MFKYQIKIEYLGTNFVGWQFQKNGVSIQGILEKILSKFLKEKILVIGSGHTITILSIEKKSREFHARHSAKERIYKYFIINRQSSLVLEKDKAWHIKSKLDIKIMKQGAKILKGTHNFSTFRASSCQAKSPVKTMKKVTISKIRNQIVLTFQSKSFLKQQVRSIVGSLKYLGEGKWSLKHFKNAFKSKKRSMCAPTAPAYGLYLYKVRY